MKMKGVLLFTFALVGVLAWSIALLAPAWKDAHQPVPPVLPPAVMIESEFLRRCYEWVSDRTNHPQIFNERSYGFRYPRPHECVNCHRPRSSFFPAPRLAVNVSRWIEPCNVSVGIADF